MEKKFSFLVNEEEFGQRIDKFLADQGLDLSRARIQKLIKEYRVLVNGEVLKKSYRVINGDEIQIMIPEPKKLEIPAEDIPLEIVYEDDYLLVVNKPVGMVVHPATGHYSGTLVNALLFHCKNLSGINGIMRPGIVHRLDKDTTGLLMVAKNDKAHLNLSKQIEERHIKREYNVIVRGVMKEDNGVIEAPIGRHPVDRKKMAVVQGGREAETEFSVIERYKAYSFLKVILKTGRTHQIRVHLTHYGYPVLGDGTYGRKGRADAELSSAINRQALHAKTLGFQHPRSNELMEFRSSLPDDMEKALGILREQIS